MKLTHNCLAKLVEKNKWTPIEIRNYQNTLVKMCYIMISIQVTQT